MRRFCNFYLRTNDIVLVSSPCIRRKHFDSPLLLSHSLVIRICHLPNLKLAILNIQSIKNSLKQFISGTTYRLIMACRSVVLKGFQPLRNYASQSREGAIKSLGVRKDLFQTNNGIPVHLKGGQFDSILYRATFFGSVCGVILSFYTVYQLMHKGKK